MIHYLVFVKLLESLCLDLFDGVDLPRGYVLCLIDLSIFLAFIKYQSLLDLPEPSKSIFLKSCLRNIYEYCFLKLFL